MIEFIKSIFETPSVLWTLPQQLFAIVMFLIALGIIIGIYFLIKILIERIKYKGCLVRKSGIECNEDCKNCVFKDKNKK